MYVEIELNKKEKKEILILKVWFYGNSIKLRQSPTHASDFTAGILVATLSDAWYYRVSAETGWHSVSTM